MAFWALAEMVKGQAGILETDSAEQAGAKLRAATEDVLEEPGEARWVETHLRPLVGIAGEGELGGEGPGGGVRRLEAVLRGARRARGRS